MVPEINWLAVIVAAVATIAIGSVWYTPKVFGTMRAKDARVRPHENGWVPIVVGVITAFVTSWVLAGAAAIAHHFYGGSFLANSVITSIILWAGLAAARFITHDAFENRPRRLTLLTIAHELVTFLAIAFIIGLFGNSGDGAA
ncbi:DUF1761 domain-containing protein [Salinibacterium sp. dk2585]|uniref:DUF1761 domain-containing protein n=1 Tax=unclassified Salinibacterium TaxID=2632331 RepID=UPI0011C247A3|nr:MULTISPECIES: DUF1761 domain-containing protein [unclassified Salinibacterium]QEE62104.1 DUF1761 domain-containing protein [Salinibacterium sp. dk2585]TXK53456.1 DUF1761 domain-containing protein [Salinibacterium sp. dk5596]